MVMTGPMSVHTPTGIIPPGGEYESFDRREIARLKKFGFVIVKAADKRGPGRPKTPVPAAAKKAPTDDSTETDADNGAKDSADGDTDGA